jgi:hypothetical protein
LTGTRPRCARACRTSRASQDRCAGPEQRNRNVEGRERQSPEVPLGHRLVAHQPSQDPAGVRVCQQDLLVGIAEIAAPERGIDHQHAVALLDVVPAGEECHRVPGIAQRLRVAEQQSRREQEGDQDRRTDPGPQITQIQAAIGFRIADDVAEGSIEDLVRMNEVRVIDDIGQQDRQIKGARIGRIRNHPDEDREQQQRAAAEAQEVESRGEEGATRLFGDASSR